MSNEIKKVIVVPKGANKHDDLAILAQALGMAMEKGQLKASADSNDKPQKITFYVNKVKKTIVAKIGILTAKVKCSENDPWNEYTGMLAAYIKLHEKNGLRRIAGAEVIYQGEKDEEETEAPIEAPKAVELAIDEQLRQFASFVPQPDCGFVPVLRRKSQESTNPDRKVEKVGSSKKKAKK